MLIEERLEHFSIPEPNSGCYIWIGGLNSDGYGVVWHDGRSARAARVAFELKNGPIPKELVIDHLCKNRACVNPDHLETVTQKVNFARGARSELRKFVCDTCGGPYEVLNTRRNGRHRRGCKQCTYTRTNKWRRDNRAHSIC